MNRRDFLRTGLLSAAALAGASALPAMSTGGLDAQGEAGITGRQRLARHRQLFNGDCNFLFYNPELWQPEGGRFGVAAIERYLAVIAAAGIDTLLVNPNTQVAWYPSRELPHILQGYTRGNLDFACSVAAGLVGMTPVLAETYARNFATMLDLYLDLAESGIDWLAECARIARARGMSPWLTYRMNPTHFSARLPAR